MTGFEPRTTLPTEPQPLPKFIFNDDETFDEEVSIGKGFHTSMVELG